MRTVRARFKLDLITLSQGAREFIFNPVKTVEADNIDWSKWTPCGSVKMVVTNPEAFVGAKPGDQFYLDFIPIE